MTDRVLNIRTSERSSFKRCRRAWGWGSTYKAGRASKEEPIFFWLGTGIHFALEDYHGYNVYGSPVDAWNAFVVATKKTEKGVPEDWAEGNELAVGMLEYYLRWLQGRDPLKTLYIDGVPQCEVRFEIPMDVKPPPGYDKVNYVGTFDRVCEDSAGQLWLVDYKTAQKFQHMHLETDQQISSYMWAASVLYEKPIAGFVYQQHRKTLPKQPRVLQNGKLSTAKQVTTWRLYNDALRKLYGNVDAAPRDNIRFLNDLAAQESEERDAFIRRDRTSRNQHQLESEGVKITLELEDILNPDLPLYPNPTMQCSWCQFQDACIALDDGSDWEAILHSTTTTRDEDTSWRQLLQ